MPVSSLLLQDIVVSILQILVLIFVIFRVSRFYREDKGLFPLFFAFAMFSLLLSDIYYLIYDFLRPDTRMPFAANEIAECATVLLLSAGLESGICKKKGFKTVPFVIAVLFISLNIALWIAWSGEWIQDIVFGLPYVYLLYLLIVGIMDCKALSLKAGVLLAILTALVVIPDALEVWVPALSDKHLSMYAYIPLAAISLILFILSIKEKEDNDKKLLISLLFFLWSTLAMYMSGGVFYTAAQVVNTGAIIICMLKISSSV